MFTLKHTTPMGNDTLISAAEVCYSPHPEPKALPCGDDEIGKFGPVTGSVWYLRQFVPGESTIEIMNGIVYVMNDKGSTVAKYDLGGWSVPLPAH